MNTKTQGQKTLPTPNLAAEQENAFQIFSTWFQQVSPSRCEWVKAFGFGKDKEFHIAWIISPKMSEHRCTLYGLVSKCPILITITYKYVVKAYGFEKDTKSFKLHEFPLLWAAWWSCAVYANFVFRPQVALASSHKNEPPFFVQRAPWHPFHGTIDFISCCNWSYLTSVVDILKFFHQ